METQPEYLILPRERKLSVAMFLLFRRFRNKIESSDIRFRNDQDYYVHEIRLWVQFLWQSIYFYAGTKDIIPTNGNTGPGNDSGGIFQLAKDIGVVLISYMLGVDEEDYYNPTIIQNSATRKKDEEEIHLHDIPHIKVYHFVILSKVPQGYFF